jgi:response regulator RpfG family c-di-GMP phosphodiesterase
MESQGKILIVDDEFGPRDPPDDPEDPLRVHTADSGDAALKFLRDNPTIDLVTLDLNMPGMGGLETLMRIKRLDPEMEAIIITGVGTVETLSKALQVGAFDHIAKPFNLVEINLLVRRAITRRRLREKFKTLFPAGTDVAQMITGFLNRRSRKDDVSFLDFVRVFSLTMQDKDPEMFSHVNRVTFFSMLLADRFGFPSEEKENLQVGALLHDIGRLGAGDPGAGLSEELNAAQGNASGSTRSAESRSSSRSRSLPRSSPSSGATTSATTGPGSPMAFAARRSRWRPGSCRSRMPTTTWRRGAARSRR